MNPLARPPERDWVMWPSLHLRRTETRNKMLEHGPSRNAAYPSSYSDQSQVLSGSGDVSARASCQPAQPQYMEALEVPCEYTSKRLPATTPTIRKNNVRTKVTPVRCSTKHDNMLAVRA